MAVIKTPSGKVLESGPKEPIRFKLRGTKIVRLGSDLKRIYAIRN